MLQDLHIRHYTIIEELSLTFSPGMTVVTGETGAGKSIAIDALSLTLGTRCQQSIVRNNCSQCEITASFDLKNIPSAKDWLQSNDFHSEDECILRRIINKEGRSKSFINGSPVTLQQLKQLGDLLVHIHGQHQHQALLKKEEQRVLLDDYANHDNLLNDTKECFQQWKAINEKMAHLKTLSDHKESRLELIRYQEQELSKLDLKKDEIEQLHQEQERLANAGQLISACQTALTAIDNSNEESALSLCYQAKQTLNSLHNKSCQTIITTIDEALIHLQEANCELSHYVDQLELNPERLQVVEQRLSLIYELARKHRCEPENLPDIHQQLITQLDNLENSQQKLIELEKALAVQEKSYEKASKALSQSRQQAAEKLSKAVTKSMQLLGMGGGQFTIDCTILPQHHYSVHGLDDINFLVNANPGQTLQPLNKVASGGELSRISLAIQVITAQAEATPTLIFDEVDVGIGGSTAEIVGQLLRQLGKKAQVLCITHLPQVAAQGHHHLQVRKESHNNQTTNQAQWLNKEARIQELARMLGGVKITAQTLAHAEELLADPA